jgi:hypothetical protein
MYELLAAQPYAHRFLGVVGDTVERHDVLEELAGIVVRLQHARDHRRLEGADEPHAGF